MGSFPCCVKPNEKSDKNKVIEVFDLEDDSKL